MAKRKGSKFLGTFTKKLLSRKCKNIILKLQPKNGDWKEGAQLYSLIVECFENLFSSTGIEGPTDFLQPHETKITEAMNEELG